eukprot:3362744-Prymnesium_polylepis.2
MCLDGDLGGEPLACFSCVAGLALFAFVSGLRVRPLVVVPRAASGVGLARCVIQAYFLVKPVGGATPFL